MRESQIRFIRLQGFPSSMSSPDLYAALMLQPKIVGGVFVAGALLQSPLVFLLLSVALLWGAVVPAYNPFDAIYNRAVAAPRGLPKLGAAPAPRRFAAGLAATVALAIAAALAWNKTATALTLEAVFAVSVAAVVWKDSCAGANVYHLLRRALSPKVSARTPPVSMDARRG